jgi:hypothetical protein
MAGIRSSRANIRVLGVHGFHVHKDDVAVFSDPPIVALGESMTTKIHLLAAAGAIIAVCLAASSAGASVSFGVGSPVANPTAQDDFSDLINSSAVNYFVDSSGGITVSDTQGIVDTNFRKRSAATL